MESTSLPPPALADGGFSHGFSGGFGSSWLLLGLLLAILITLPWLLRRWQQQWQQRRHAQGGTLVQTLGATAVGPTQRVVTVEIARGNQRVCLVLGVTPNQINCLYTIPDLPASYNAQHASNDTPSPDLDFANLLKNQPMTPPGSKAPGSTGEPNV